MKKYITYIGVLAIGLLIGWLAFGNNSKEKIQDHTTETAEEHWTCSMHPQIDLPQPGACPICGMDLIPKTASEEGLASDQFKMTKNAIALANIETIVIGNGSGNSNKLILSGKISANDKTSALQTAHFGGRIEQLNFKTVGEFVSKGALVATIYSPELLTAQNELIEAISIKESQPELYKAVRNKLKYWKVSEKQIQRIEQTKKVQSNFKMYANVSGYISEIFIEEGNHVTEGTPLFNVSNLGSVWADLDVYEKDIKNIKLGQEIEIYLNAYPDKIITAKIDFIDPILNNATRTVLVRTTLNNKDNYLKPGMLITSEIVVNSKDNGSFIMVPKTAVMWTGKRSVVYVKASKSEPVFEMREVKLGNDSGANFEVLEGLKGGEEVVFNGTFTVDAAAQLQGKASMMNRSENNYEEEITKTLNIDKSKVDAEFKKQLGNAVSEYMKLKDALVAEDASNGQKKAEDLKKSLNNVDMSLLKGDAHNEWMRILKQVKPATEDISNSNDIKVQRNSFLVLGKSFSEAINTFGIDSNNKPIYLEFCPMANDDKGGYWLSFEKEIKNPYFGKAMMSCGEVKATY